MHEPPEVEELRARISVFGTYDYAVFAGTLIGCTLFGLYYAFRRKNSVDDATEYLMGGRSMSIFPIATSLIASSTSGIVLLGVPAEIYLYGTEYAFVGMAIILNGMISSYLILPVFHKMRLFSAYGYLEIRFDRNVRLFCSLIFTIFQICWLVIIVYVPALALNQVMGMNVHFVTPWVCMICILYTCLGGLKAAVLSNVLPVWCMVGSVILVTIKASFDVGGFQEVWQRNQEGGRLLIPNFELDPTLRHTFWGICFGGMIMELQESIFHQNVLQRYFSLPSVSNARRALWTVVFMKTSLILICCYAGLVIYAVYRDCDPLTTKLTRSRNQLLPLLVMKTLGDIPGVPGLFAVGIFGASLSSLSTGLNSISAVVLEDFIKPFLSKELCGRATSLILRGVVILFGVLFVFLISAVEKLGTALQHATSLVSMLSGPAFGVFFSGIFLPWVNAKGALLGGLLGLFTSGIVVIGAQNAAAGNKLRFSTKPTSVEGCLYYYNATIFGSDNSNETRTVFPLFKISYLWYTTFGGFTTVLLALLISAASGFSDLKYLNPNCFPPIVRHWLPVTKTRSQKPDRNFLIKDIKNNKIPYLMGKISVPLTDSDPEKNCVDLLHHAEDPISSRQFKTTPTLSLLIYCYFKEPFQDNSRMRRKIFNRCCHLMIAPYYSNGKTVMPTFHKKWISLGFIFKKATTSMRQQKNVPKVSAGVLGVNKLGQLNRTKLTQDEYHEV